MIAKHETQQTAFSLPVRRIVYEGDEGMSAINWSAIDWVSLVALSLLVLIAARIGERLSFGSRGLSALITALLFAGGFAVWSYALHDTLSQVFATAPVG